MNLHKPPTLACDLSEQTELLPLAKYGKTLVQHQNPSHSVVSSSFSSPQTTEWQNGPRLLILRE